MRVCYIDFGPANLDSDHHPSFRLTARIFNGLRSALNVETHTPNGWVGYAFPDGSIERLYAEQARMATDKPFEAGVVRVVYIDVRVPRKIADDMLSRLETEEKFTLALGSLDVKYRIEREHHRFRLPESVRVTRPITCRENQTLSLSPATVEVDVSP